MRNQSRQAATAGAVAVPSAGVDVAFRSLGRSDFSRLRRWLNEPAIVRWYSPDRPSRAAIEHKYGPRIAGQSATRVHVVLLDGSPAGIVQTYAVDAYPEYATAIGARPGWAGLDYLIGEPAFRGRRLAHRIVETFVATVIGGDAAVTACAALPAVRNLRSIRALERAGFERLRRLRLAPGRRDQLMLLELRPAEQRSADASSCT